MNYWFGYYGLPSSYQAFGFLMAFFGLVEFIILSVLLIALIFFIFQRENRLWATTMLAWFLVLVGLKLMLAHPDSDDLVIYGLRDRIMRDCKVDTLQNLAREIDMLPTPTNLPAGVGKVFMAENLDSIKINLKEKYAFLKGRNVSSIIEENGVVSIWWGRQQWGFSVVVNGGTDSAKLEGQNCIIILPVSKDIFFKTMNSD